jgi:hypothetical protein
MLSPLLREHSWLLPYVSSVRSCRFQGLGRLALGSQLSCDPLVLLDLPLRAQSEQPLLLIAMSLRNQLKEREISSTIF